VNLPSPYARYDPVNDLSVLTVASEPRRPKGSLNANTEDSVVELTPTYPQETPLIGGKCQAEPQFVCPSSYTFDPEEKSKQKCVKVKKWLLLVVAVPCGYNNLIDSFL
jgi:hypothetical protein